MAQQKTAVDKVARATLLEMQPDDDLSRLETSSRINP
jgi:hypothetical protein